jgi:hypothetical protein
MMRSTSNPTTTLSGIVLLVAALALAPAAMARPLAIAPANPTALEFVHLRTTLSNCEQVLGVEPTNGGLRVVIRVRGSGATCGSTAPLDLTLGAFPPGTYRLQTRLVGDDFSPPFDEPDTITFTVSTGPSSTAPGDDLPSIDLSGVWTTPSEPYTGFFFIEAGALDAQGRRRGSFTGIWYDYSGAQATWTLLLSGLGTSQIFRPIPTGTGANRTVTFAPVGTARIVSRAGMGGPESWYLRGTIDGRDFDYPLERFRWTRAAWPGRAPDPP